MPDGTLVGLDEASVARACAGADLFLNLSGACWLRDAYRGARVTAYVDTDPCYSQAKLAATEAGVADRAVARSAALIRQHDVFFTLGEHVGTAGLHGADRRHHVAPDAAAGRSCRTGR